MLATGWDLNRSFSQTVIPGFCVVLPFPHSKVAKFQNKCPRIFSWAPRSLRTVSEIKSGHEIKKTLAPWKESYDKSRQHIKRRDITLLTKVCIIKLVIYGCESWP